jgi:hypothetical protein
VLFTISAVALALSAVVLLPLQGGPDSGDWFTATLTIVIGLVALVSSGAGWWFLSGRRFGVGARLFVLSEAMLLAGTAIAFDQRPRWHEASPDTASLAVLPLLLLALAVCGAPLALVGVRAMRNALAERRAADTSTVDGYLARLSVCLHTTPPLRRRILREAEDHLRIAATEVGEKKAIERFGSPEQLAEAFAGESRVASAYAVAWTVLAAISVELAALLATTSYSMMKAASLAGAQLAGLPDTFWFQEGGVRPRLEPLSSALSMVPPPFRGGLAVAFTLAALMALSSAVAAAAVVRRRPRLAVGCTATAIVLGALAFGLAAVLGRHLGRYGVPLLPHVKWLALAIAGILVVALWCAIELEVGAVRSRRTAIAVGAVVLLPLLAGTYWRAPQPPSTGYWGWPPSPWLESGPWRLGSALDDPVVALGAGEDTIAFAWVGWSRLSSEGEQTKAKLRVYISSNARGSKARRSSVALAVANPESIRALAVLPTAHSQVLAWGTDKDLWLRLGTGPSRPIASAHVGALQLLSVRGHPTLIAAVGERLVMARAPRWSATPLVGAAGTLLSARPAGSGFALLTSRDGRLRFEARTASGRVAGSWSIPARNVGGGTVGQLPDGRMAFSFAGVHGGRYSLWLESVRDGRLVSQLVATDQPCVRPLALGSVDGSAAVLTGSRCQAPGRGSMFAPSLPGTSQFISRNGSWQRYQLPDWVYDDGAILDGAPYAIRAFDAHGGGTTLIAVGGNDLVMP